jgi:hypothetical protein
MSGGLEYDDRREKGPPMVKQNIGASMSPRD